MREPMSAKRLEETRERVREGDLWLSDAEYLVAEVDRLRAQVDGDGPRIKEAPYVARERKYLPGDEADQ